MKSKYIVLICIVFVIVYFGNFSSKNTKDPVVNGSKTSNIDIEISKKYIEDIYAASLYNPLEKKGFKIDKETGGDGIFVNCDRSLAEFTEHVRISGDGFDKINEIKAFYTNYSNGDTNELSIPFLSFIATLPYKNSNPEQAKMWILENISKNSKIEINGVSFEIFANNKNTRTLLITPVGADL